MTNKPVIFYDGECGLCHWFVRFVLNTDKQANFLFSPQQGESAKRLLGEFAVSKLPDSVYLLDTDQKLYLKAQAVFLVLVKLGGFWALIGRVLNTLPLSFVNYFYDLIAASRKKIFKKSETLCPVMPKELQERFLN